MIGYGERRILCIIGSIGGDMGDVGEAFEAMNEYKLKERAIKEPNRFKYAWDKLSSLNLTLGGKGEQEITIYLGKGNITLWVFTGWFCGNRPYGKIKGRGIENLLRQIKSII
jgi:hypothetical protein